jgi:hypothetical protein
VNKGKKKGRERRKPGLEKWGARRMVNDEKGKEPPGLQM